MLEDFQKLGVRPVEDLKSRAARELCGHLPEIAGASSKFAA